MQEAQKVVFPVEDAVFALVEGKLPLLPRPAQLLVFQDIAEARIGFSLRQKLWQFEDARTPCHSRPRLEWVMAGRLQRWPAA